MERGQIVLEHTVVEGEEELWQEDGGDYDGWFCVRTDPFPCPASGCSFVAEFMTAAHLILVWQELDDINLLRHAARARDVGRNPRVTGYRSEFGPERVVLRVGRGGPPGARRQGTHPVVIGEQRFGETAPFSLGVEEELMILDAETFEQVAAVDRILRGVEGVALPGSLKTELFASVFEINTNVCTTAGEIGEALPALRRAAAAAAAAEGLAIAAAATHPFARPEAQPIVKEERYVTFVGYGGISVRRQGVQGLHVHVGMPSGEDCWRCLEAIVPWLPVVLGMSANSPWFAGELNGMASNRAPILAELPRAGAPPAFASYQRVGVVGRAGSRSSVLPRTTRESGGTSVRIRSSGRSRCASPTSRRTSGSRRRSQRSCRRSARPRSPAGCRRTACCWATAAAPTTARTAGRRRGSGPVRGSCIRPAGATCRPPSSAPNCSSSSGRRRRSSAAPICSRASTPQSARPTCSSSRNRRTPRRRTSSTAR